MPRILALEEREGALWAKLALHHEDRQPVHLLTETEIASIKAQALRSFFEEIAELLAKRI